MEPLHLRHDPTLSLRAASPSNLSKGFTLVELLVATAIIFVIATVALVSQSSFNKTIILSNTAYDVALSLRSAASFGLGSRVAGGVANTGYGIHFPMFPTTSYSLFADANLPGGSCHPLPPGGASAPDAQYGDCAYSADEKVSDYMLGNGITISRICVRKGAIPTCQNIVGSLDVVFAQPNAEPFMSVNGSYSAAPAVVVNSACVQLKSPTGVYQYVSVTSSGRIMASATSCI